VTLAQRGNEFAFAEIVRRYRVPLVAFASAYAPSDQAEDVVQESLMRSWTAIRGSDREIALKPWLYTIVRNRALNARRDTRLHEPLDETLDGIRPPSEIVLEREELSRVVAAVAALPEPQREALVRSALDGRTHEQIAAELGATPGSVRGMIHRGRVAVRGAAGAVLPLPLVMALAGGAGGTAAGGLAAGSTGLAGKATAIAAVGVVALGSGVVVERSLRDGKEERGPELAHAQPSPDRADARSSRGTGRGAGDVGRPSSHASGEGGGRKSGGGGDDASEEDEREDESGEDDGDREHEGERDDHSDDRSGHDGSGSSHDDEEDEDESDSDDGSGSSGSGSSGSGSSGSGSSGSGHSGSGGGDDRDDGESDEDEDEPDDD
jgi:RNA polymerase sigma factor (sigma-70 family)